MSYYSRNNDQAFDALMEQVDTECDRIEAELDERYLIDHLDFEALIGTVAIDEEDWPFGVADYLSAKAWKLTPESKRVLVRLLTAFWALPCDAYVEIDALWCRILVGSTKLHYHGNCSLN